MSDYKHKENAGSLFVNTYKKEGSNQPDYRGTANVNGEEVEISGWKKETNDGKVFLSLSFQEPYKKETISDVKPKAKVNPTENEGDLPF